MKAQIVLLLALLALIGCSNQQEADKASPSQDELLVAASQKLVKQFGSSLKKELIAAMNDGGFEKAILVCNEKAAGIAADFSTDDWTIKRVSDKNRSVENNASEHEQSILAKFDSDDSLAFFAEIINAFWGTISPFTLILTVSVLYPRSWIFDASYLP